MKFPHPDKESIAFFKSQVPENPHVSVKPMFGNLSAFVNGNMFFGLFGNELFLRLSLEDQQELLESEGARYLEPMKGRPMKDYVMVPKNWMSKPETVRTWVSKALGWSLRLPAKKTKK